VWGEKSLYGRKYMGMERATFLVNARASSSRPGIRSKSPAMSNGLGGGQGLVRRSMKKPSKKFWRHAPSPRPASRSFFWHRRLIGKSRAGDASPVAVPDAHSPQPQPG